MKFLKILLNKVYLNFTEKSFDEGVRLGMMIGELNSNTKMYWLFDPESKKKLSEAEVHARIVASIKGE